MPAGHVTYLALERQSAVGASGAARASRGRASHLTRRGSGSPHRCVCAMAGSRRCSTSRRAGSALARMAEDPASICRSLPAPNGAALLAGRPVGAADEGPTVCACFQVGRNRIASVVAKGPPRPPRSAWLTRAGTNCGSCLPELKRLLARPASLASPRSSPMRVVPPRETPRRTHAAPRRAAGILRSEGSASCWRALATRCLEGGAGRGGRRARRGVRARSSGRARRAVASSAGRQHHHHRRRWRADDLAGCALAIGALEGEEAAAFAAAAREARRARQHRRHAGPVHLQLRHHRQSLARGRRHQHRRRRARAGPSHPRQDRGAAAPRARRVGAAAERLRGASRARLPMGPARRDLWRRFADRALAAAQRADRARSCETCFAVAAQAARSPWSVPGRAIPSC